MPSLSGQWTVQDVHALPDDGNRYEVIDGELFVTPAPAPRHQAAVGELHALLREYLRANRVGYPFVAPVDIIFSPKRLVQPDVLVAPPVNGRRPQKIEDADRLLLVVEVLSPSTARADRVAKRTLYRDEGLPEYWIVDLDARTIERSTPEDTRVEVISDRLQWQPRGAATPFELDLDMYFREVLDE